MIELHNRIVGALIDYRDTSPEEGESWESWYYAAFDMAMEKIVGLLDEACEQPVAGEDGLRVALVKIDAIRNSIIGFQNVGWSDHIYPLVAALEKAGFRGLGYEKAKANVQAMLDERAELEARAALSTSAPAGMVGIKPLNWPDAPLPWSIGTPDGGLYGIYFVAGLGEYVATNRFGTVARVKSLDAAKAAAEADHEARIHSCLIAPPAQEPAR